MSSNINKDSEEFRANLATVDTEGKRKWVYAQQPSGRFYNARSILSYTLLALLLAMPFFKVNGHPIFLFNVLERKFILFGVLFGPQDFFILGLGLITIIIFIVLFTLVFGRLFCGWVCPQTIFMEMVFRRIEYWLEGNPNEQRILNNAPWDTNKIIKKTTKHAIFYAIAFAISNYFLAYMIGADAVMQIIKDPVEEHLSGFAGMVGFSFVFYGVFSNMREQVCTVICPYGRLQGVLLDPDSVVVAYDYGRGEKRAKFKKNEVRTAGDCIDCHQCVKVCPTGIDIRNGTQMECVGCTACIDACDFMMDKVGLPRGLIRYASDTNIANRTKFKITTKIKAYSAVLVLLVGIMAFLLATRQPLNVTIVRVGGMLYQEQPDNRLSNLYNVMYQNKSYDSVRVKIVPLGANAQVQMVGREIVVAPEDSGSSSFFIILPKSDLTGRKTTVELGIYANDQQVKTLETSFIGPGN